MKTFLKNDENTTFTAPGGGVTVDVPVLIGALLVIPKVTVAAGLPFAGVAEGVFFNQAKTAGQAWAEGQLLYWDTATSSFCTVPSATARRVGVAYAAALAGDATGTVRLTGSPAPDAELGTIADSAVSPTPLVGGAPFLIPIDIPDAATATYVYKTQDKIEIIDAWNIKDTAGAGNTLQITDGADAAITNAMAAAVDKTVTHAGTIDKAKRVLAAGATFKVVATRAAGSMAAQLFILAIRRA